MDSIKYLTILFLTILITACSTKDDKTLYNNIKSNAKRYEILKSSQKIIFEQGDNQIIVIATYLPKISQKQENLIVSIFPTSEAKILSRSQLNGKYPISIKRLNRDTLSSDITDDIPSWFSIYRVTYPYSKEELLEFNLTAYGARKGITFSKVPKYLLSRGKMIFKSN